MKRRIVSMMLVAAMGTALLAGVEKIQQTAAQQRHPMTQQKKTLRR